MSGECLESIWRECLDRVSGERAGCALPVPYRAARSEVIRAIVYAD